MEGDIILNNCEDITNNNNNNNGTANMTADSSNKTIITDETPNLGETGDILSDLKLTS